MNRVPTRSGSEHSTMMMAASNILALSDVMSDGIVLAIVGVGVVFSALTLIWGATSLVGRVLSGSKSPEPQSTPQAPTPAADPDSLDSQTVAVISAAVAAVAGTNTKIRRITRVHRQPGSAWASHGRVAVQSVHRMRKK